MLLSIKNLAHQQITKDGVTVAKEIELISSN
jgi:chaperonin GroEL (HSP60 family)